MAEDLIDIPFEVFQEEHGSRADVFLSRRIKRMSRSKAAALIREGVVRRADGPPIDRPSVRVMAGDRVLLKRKKLNEAPTDDIVLPIEHEDEDLLAVNKPGDLVVHPTASAYHRTLIRVMRTRRPGQYLELAHRIDKETSGLLLLSKNPETDSFLKSEFAERRVKKSYLAVVAGRMPSDRMMLDAPMRLSPSSVTSVRMEIGGEGASPAVTEVEVLARSDRASLVEARPLTGRQHQIRLHLAHAGHPIIGDKLYLGGDEVFLRAIRERLGAEEVTGLVGHHRHALHAHTATFVHPKTKSPLTLRAPLAPDLVDLAARLGVSAP
jgi:23S rRNA pseudouridine1911/1915/1917 synthase